MIALDPAHVHPIVDVIIIVIIETIVPNVIDLTNIIIDVVAHVKIVVGTIIIALAHAHRMIAIETTDAIARKENLQDPNELFTFFPAESNHAKKKT